MSAPLRPDDAQRLEQEVRKALEHAPQAARRPLAALLWHFRGDGYWRWRGRILLAAVYYAAGRNAAVERLLREVLERSPNAQARDEAQEELGHLLASQGRTLEALTAFRSLLEQGEVRELPRLKVAGLEGLSLVHNALEDRAASLDHQLQALELRRAHPELPGMAMALSNLSVDYHEVGQLELARSFALEGLTLAHAEDNLRVETVALNSLGEIALHENPAEAAAQFGRLLEHTAEQASPRRRTWGVLGLGRALAILGQHERAQAALEEALALSETHALLTESLEARLHLARLQAPEQALASLERGLALSREHSFSAPEARFERALSETLERLNRFPEALAHLKRFVVLEEERGKLRSQQRAEVLAARFASEQHRRDANLWRERSRSLASEVRRDALTGLPNRRSLDETLDAAWQRARAEERALCAAVLDLDHFKGVNDRLGHFMGDLALHEVAALLAQHAPQGATVARYGGEEFVMVLPDLPIEEAASQLERVRGLVEAHAWTGLHPELAVTLSVGVAEWQPFESTSTLLRRADAHLFEAKRRGRNRVWAG